MASQRNLVILIPHGLRSDAVGDTNVWPLLTPHMEKLAKRGLRLVATCACPADDGALISLLTGLHARQHGWLEPAPAQDPIQGFVAWLAEADYWLAGVGRIRLIQPWLHRGVPVADVSETRPDCCSYLQAMEKRGRLDDILRQRRQRQRYGLFEPDRLNLAPDEDIDGFIIAEARRLISDMPVDRPWALIVLFTGPANDLPPPMLYAEAVDPALLEAGFILPELKQLDLLAEPEYPRVLLQRMTPKKLARIRADYLGRVCLIDFGVGRIVAEAQRRADAGRTWIVLASDRGHLLGEHGLIGHRSFLCPALETPLIVVPPAPFKQRIHETAMISTIDLAPTIAHLAGCDIPATCSGRSLVPLLTGQEAPSPLDRSAGVISENGHRLMLLTERFKVVFDIESHQPLMLFDLINDSEEKQNLVGTIAGQNILDSLRWRLGDALLELRCPWRPAATPRRPAHPPAP